MEGEMEVMNPGRDPRLQTRDSRPETEQPAVHHRYGARRG